MREEIIISGFGGQGVLLAGALLCHAAMIERRFVTFFPSYGAEIRGGVVNCQVIISGTPIGAPIAYNPGILISLNEASYKKFAPAVKEKGVIFVNTSLYRPGKRSGIEILEIPANNLAEGCGTSLFANMAMLGAVISKKKIIKLGSLTDAIPEVLTEKKKSLWDGNAQAVKAGYIYTPEGGNGHEAGNKKQAL